jgi:hypothetical protein
MIATKGQIPTEYYASLHAAIRATQGAARDALEAEMRSYVEHTGLTNTVLDHQFSDGVAMAEAVTFVMRNGRELVCRTDDARAVAADLRDLPGWDARKSLFGGWRITARSRSLLGVRRMADEQADALLAVA